MSVEAQTPQPDQERKTFTGIKRRQTRRSVIVKDKVAHWIITVGGIGVTVAFATIVLFLVSVVIPMFAPTRLELLSTVPLPPPSAAPVEHANTTVSDVVLHAPAPGTGRPLAFEPDEDLTAAWVLDDLGRLSIYRLSGGELIHTMSVSDQPITALSNSRGIVAIGRSDGTARVGRIRYSLQWLSNLPDNIDALLPGQTVEYDNGVALLTPIGQVRVVRVEADLTEPLAVGEGDPSPVIMIDYVYDTTLEALVALREDGRLFFDLLRKRRNMMTGKFTTTLEKYELPWSQVKPRTERPKAVLMGQNGRMVYVVFADGHLVRYNTTEPSRSYIAEEMNLLGENSNRRLTSVSMLLGNITLIVADDSGAVSGWFAAPYPQGVEPQTPDARRMVQAHRLPFQPDAVTVAATSSRDRQFVTGDALGNIVLRHMTSGTAQGKIQVPQGRSVQLLSMAPKNNAILAVDESRYLHIWRMDNPHPDAALSELFLPVHYEGYPEPAHVWQSSAATDDAEPKHGLVPLIFGTLKATLYAMLFAVPLALLAAIYSSEFMQPQVRNVVKPLVEMMAGLPSVVLGFIAGLVLAPFIQDVLPALLLFFAAIPVGVMIFGFVWQVIPTTARTDVGGFIAGGLFILLAVIFWALFSMDSSTGRYAILGLGGFGLLWTIFWATAGFRVREMFSSYLTMTVLLQIVIGAIAVAFLLGPTIEAILFMGDIRAWLDGRLGRGTFGATPGWVVLLTPLFGLLLAVLFNLYVRQHIAVFSTGGSRWATGIADVARFVALAILAVALAGGAGAMLSMMGFDLRNPLPGLEGGLVGTYVQRNTLIIGMVMGFAIIPIIYTVSEDSLSSVPPSLRSAALGAGATPWQTAVRVILPVAASGIFSACMIGFGRAAGETMIVLMAGGNTPILDPNIFNGVRPLSANIAVELPEAPKDGTHYRILFFSALVLFAITFAVNTAAELVRMRFRKRAYQL